MIEQLPMIERMLSIAKKITDFSQLNDSAERNKLLIEFQDALIKNQTFIATIQAQNSSLSNINEDLKKEIVQLKDWSAEKQNYESLEISTGIFAYVSKDNVQPFQSAHKFCTNCFNKNIKSLLQSVRTHDKAIGYCNELICQNGCKTIKVFMYKNVQS